MEGRSLLIKPTNNLPCRLKTNRSPAGIKLPREPLHFRHLVLATLIRIHRLVSKGGDDPRSSPLKRHRCTIRCPIHPQGPLANCESPHSPLVEFYVEQIEDVPSDEESVFLCGDCVENAVEDLRGAEDVSELCTAFHPRDPGKR